MGAHGNTRDQSTCAMTTPTPGKLLNGRGLHAPHRLPRPSGVAGNSGAAGRIHATPREVLPENKRGLILLDRAAAILSDDALLAEREAALRPLHATSQSTIAREIA